MRDEAVIEAIQNRDEDTIGRIINKYSRLLWPIASAVLHKVGSEQDVEECVADAFIYLWQNPGKFDPAQGKLKSWLCIVVRSRAIDRYRELTRHGMLPLEEAMLSAGPDLQQTFLWQEARQELLEAVNRLEEPNREILIRRYYQNQKPRQIALAMGLSVKQVDNSLYRSRQNLKTILTQKGGSR